MRYVVTRSWVGRRVAHRFVAGEHVDDAMRAAGELSRRGIRAMLDHLGENVTSVEQAAAAADAYVLALKRVHEADGLDCDIAIKLTQLGLDQGFELCLENTERVLSAAQERGRLVMIDMESHGYVDATLEVVGRSRARGYDVGLAMQSYLYRTATDVFSLPEGTPVRMVKGAYLEPPSVAYLRRDDVDRAYVRITATLLARGHPVHVATHDPRLLDGVCRFVERRRIPWDRVELQMLYGIRRDLQHRYADHGYPVRAYIPYGTEWYP